ncbi:MAG: hypothetical protein Q4E68_12130 [Prevotellaceae bacterium]|nr:hypothetical protein [Prevotellaceae bacterium]
MNEGLILNTSYNDIILGTHISDYFGKRHEVISDNPFSDMVSFDFYDDRVTVWCENDIIDSICCAETCIYEGVNLIGMKFNEFLNRFHFSPNNEDIIWLEGYDEKKGQNQHVYDFDNEGLQIWVWRNRIRTVIISDYSNCLDLVLNKSYQEFVLNVPISNYFYKNYHELERDTTHPFKRYQFSSPEVEIWCKNDLIDTIICERICAYEYQGKTFNLVGFGFNAFLKLFDVTSPDSKRIYVDANNRKELRHVYEFDELGIQIWVWHKSIKTVLIHNSKESKLYRAFIETAK